MIDLEEKYIDFIRKTIRQYLQEGKIYLFGSRTKGTSRKYSDIDIALDCPNLNENILLKIIIGLVEIGIFISHFLKKVFLFLKAEAT